MAVIRKEPVGFDGEKTIYEAAVDEYSDLSTMTYAGVGTMAWTRIANGGCHRWIKLTDDTWGPVAAEEFD